MSRVGWGAGGSPPPSPQARLSRAVQSSLFTIVTIYSIMNGATMHVMPGLFLRAGILVGASVC